MKAFEIELTRLTLTYAVWEAIAFAAGMTVLYFVIKAAIRDGIRESGLVQSWRTTVAATRSTETGLPDMRADR
jgi:hypothetical protein